MEIILIILFLLLLVEEAQYEAHKVDMLRGQKKMVFVDTKTMTHENAIKFKGNAIKNYSHKEKDFWDGDEDLTKV
jgi:hypothetical protein